MTIFDFLLISNKFVLENVKFVNFIEIDTPLELDYQDFSDYFFPVEELTGDEIIYFTVFNHVTNEFLVFFGEGGFEHFYDKKFIC